MFKPSLIGFPAGMTLNNTEGSIMKSIIAALLLSLSMMAFGQTFTPEVIAEYRANAEAGDALAQYSLGYMYDNGDGGLPEDDAFAVKWYTKAAEQGNVDAQYNLGNMYRFGDGVRQNDATALKWFTKAAEQGNADAQSYLGYMYVLGKGVPEDKVMAYMWENMAAAQGDDDAKENRDSLKGRMTPAQVSKAQTLSRECLAKDYKNCG